MNIEEDHLLYEGIGESDEDIDDFSSAGSNKDSTQRKLITIEKKIRKDGLGKREKRLLQNRKSALKCRLKKQD
jgi:hypothetical protein